MPADDDYSQSVDDGRGRRAHADRARSRVRLERIPLTRQYNWTVSEVTVAFELAILVLGFAAFLGGLLIGPSSLSGESDARC